MRFDSSEIGQQLTEIVAYGTAVVARPVVRVPQTPPGGRSGGATPTGSA